VTQLYLGRLSVLRTIPFPRAGRAAEMTGTLSLRRLPIAAAVLRRFFPSQ
jgi:hypothetical protein